MAGLSGTGACAGDEIAEKDRPRTNEAANQTDLLRTRFPPGIFENKG
jgi:hypothetical protein